MLLRPYEILVPREKKAKCLQDGFNLLAIEQVKGKEKIFGGSCEAGGHNRTCCSSTRTSHADSSGLCPTEDSMQVVRDWMAHRKHRSVHRPTKLLQARNMATWLRQKELDDRKLQTPWVGGSKNMSGRTRPLKGPVMDKGTQKCQLQQSKQSGSVLPATTVDPYWEVACSKAQLSPSRVVGPQAAKVSQQRLGGLCTSDSDVLENLTCQLEKLNRKCKRVQKKGQSRTHSQFCGNYNRSEHIQALHARAQAYKNCHKL